jgi:hypothetical protein
MATFIFNGKRIIQPGFYSEVKSGINNPLIDLAFGNVLIIDKDATSFHGNGASVAGTTASGIDALYGFNSISSFRDFIGGGLLYDLAQPLFRPFGSANGVSNLFYIRALTTVPATVSLAFSNDTIVFRTLNEGISGNGTLTGSTLTRGYSATLTAGVTNASAYVLNFWRGTFKGTDPINSRPYDNKAEADTLPELIAKSPEVTTLDALVEWTTNDANFINNFEITTGADATGAIVASDLVDFASDQVFAGGTSVYATERIDEILQAIEDVNINYVLATDNQANATSVDNVKLATFFDTEMQHPPTLIVGGGNNEATFSTQSIAAAALYNTQNTVVVHGGCEIIDTTSPTGILEKDVLYKAAMITGRIAGLPPQTPVTYKGIGISGEIHNLTSGQKDQAILAGVLATYYSPELGFNVVLQGVNTIQDNRNVVNSDGTSPSIQVVRIIKQLLREMRINVIIDLLGDQNVGANRNTLDRETVRIWVVNYLKSQEATNTVDDIIIDSRDVTIQVEQDAYFVTFSVTPNYEVNKIFVTARIIDSATL